MPKFTLIGLIFVAVIYIIGARYPQLAQKIGAA